MTTLQSIIDEQELYREEIQRQHDSLKSEQQQQLKEKELAFQAEKTKLDIYTTQLAETDKNIAQIQAKLQAKGGKGAEEYQIELNDTQKQLALIQSQLVHIIERMKNDFGIDLNKLENQQNLS